METNEKPTGLFPKLLLIQKKVNGLAKDNSGYGYKYVSGEKVLSYIKPLMNEYGLLLKQEVLKIKNTRQDYQTKQGAKSEILSKVKMRFTWIDVETGERDKNLFGANGQNDWEKGLGSALTYAERYFLLKYFHIATDEDDVDNADRKTNAPVTYEDMIKNAQSVEDLAKVWASIPPSPEKNKLEAVKNKRKSELSADLKETYKEHGTN